MLLRVCQVYAREFTALLAEEEFAGLQLETCTVNCGSPGEGPEGLESDPGKILAAMGEWCRVGPGTAQHRKAGTDVHLCFDMIAGEAATRDYLASGYHLLSPGWLDEWPARMDDWGFDRLLAREFFADCRTRFLLLDTGVSPESARQLAELAEYTRRPAMTVQVGLAPAREFLRSLRQQIAVPRS